MKASAEITKVESLLLAFVLVAAFHGIHVWVWQFLPAQSLRESLGREGIYILYHALSGIMPLLLCLAAPSRSGLTLGSWRGKVPKVLGICTGSIGLTALVYPFTSRPFSGQPMSRWLVSPAAQDLLFAGYLYGLFTLTFPGHIHHKVRVNRSVVVTAIFFALWHLPNLQGIPISYVSFQLFYTFVGGAWVLLARQLTGSLVPGILTHMAVNYIASL